MQKRNTENIFTRMSNDYYHLTNSEKKVASFVLSHKTKAQYMSISELAEECGVAEATISRFCRRLQFEGYNAFKLALAKATVTRGKHVAASQNVESEIQASDSIEEMCHKLYASCTAALSQSMELINPDSIKNAVDFLVAAKQVLCVGNGGSAILAENAQQLMSTVSSKFIHIRDSHMQISSIALMKPGDVLWVFSYSGSTKELMEFLPVAHEQGLKVVLVTRFAKSPGASEADVVLQCGSTEGPLELGSIPARLAQLYVLDVVYNEYIRRKPDKNAKNLEKIADILTKKHL